MRPPTLLLLLLLPSTALAWLSMEGWDSGNVTASAEEPECVCRVYLPDTNFPVERVEHMQQVTQDLILEAEIQMKKMVSYKGELEIFLAELKNLTFRVAILESNPDNYVQLDFELLRVELREFEALVAQLRESLNSSSPALDSLHAEIHNMSRIVDQLETYDKSNLEMIRVEFIKLQRILEECQEETKVNKPDIGNCDHGVIVGVGEPVVGQLNAHLNVDFRFGGWGKDSKPVRGFESMYWYGAYSSPSVYEFNLYSNYDQLILRSSFTHHALPQGYEGTGNNYIVHGNAIYYQTGNPFRMSKLNLTTSVYNQRDVPKASERFTYIYSPKQYLDFSADEKGLWVIYATEEAKGKMVIAKIDEQSFGIEDEWTTGAFKSLAGNAFMACGVMYATRPGDLTTEEIFYSYDTRTGREKHLSVPLRRFQESFANLHYNPTDQKLYMYNQGYYVSYDVKFDTDWTPFYVH